MASITAASLEADVQWSKSHGETHVCISVNHAEMIVAELSALSAQVVAVRNATEMRERCAKLCDSVAQGAHKAAAAGADRRSIEQVKWTAEDMAKAIRALPDQKD